MNPSTLELIALDVRRRLYSSQYGCLTSFLSNLAHACGADEAGLISLHDGELQLRRSSSSNSCFLEIQNDLLQSVHHSTDETHTINNLARYRWIAERRRNVVLRRIWPAEAWRNHRRETFWLYILAPRLIFPQIKESPSDDEVEQLGGLAAAFVRWKNELFSQHSEALSESFDDSAKVLQEFRKFVVHPVRADHFYCILSGFNPTDQDARRWCRTIDQLVDACKKPLACRCFVDPLMEAHFKCPQTVSMDNVISTMGKLEKWRTKFWRPEHCASADARCEILTLAVQGLEEAKRLIHWRDRESDESKVMDFAEGAVGYGGERALLRYFCSTVISMSVEKLRDTWTKSECYPADLEFAASLASLASLVLGDGRWTPEAIQNLLNVVATFGHKILGIPARIDLVRHLQQTLRGETALHTLKSRYRDHFFHTLEVCFLGFLTLTSRPDKEIDMTFGAKLIESCKTHREELLNKATTDTEKKRLISTWPPLPNTEKELLAQWWCASLIHDTAYGIDIFDGTLTLLKFFTNRKEVDTFIGSARKTVEVMAEDLRKVAPELAEDPSIKRGDHGVIAACSLKNILDAIGPLTARRFEPAIRAIAFHNTRFPKVDGAIDPVAALLILCDTVQEWGRSSLGFDRSPAVLLSRMIEASSIPAEDQFGPVKRYGISVHPNLDGVDPQSMPKSYDWNVKDKLSIELDYGMESLKECRAKFTWTDMTYNLQRVDFRPWDVDISVQVSVPIPIPDLNDPKARKGPIKTQFEYFGEFIAQQQVRFMELWFRLALEKDPTKAVCHSTMWRDASARTWVKGKSGEKGVRELITFRLNELSRLFCDEQAVMGGHVGNFSDAIKLWTEYFKEQEPNPAAVRPPV